MTVGSLRRTDTDAYCPKLFTKTTTFVCLLCDELRNNLLKDKEEFCFVVVALCYVSCVCIFRKKNVSLQAKLSRRYRAG